MTPHPRTPIILKAIKWGGTMVTVLLVVVWIGSGWWVAEAGAGSEVTFQVFQGEWLVRRIAPANALPAPTPPRWAFERITSPVAGDFAHFRWWLCWSSWKPNWILGIPGWIPSAIALLITLTAWRLDTLAPRRALGRLNLCPTCNYDRAGIREGAACPECGAASKIA